MIKFQSPRLEESFSFTSSLLLFSDDGDNYNDDYNDDDAYIEIALEPAQTPPIPTHENEEGNTDAELEFRMSISSVVPLPGFSSSSCSSTTTLFSSTATCSNESADAYTTMYTGVPASAGSELSCIRRTNKQNEQYSRINRLFNVFLSSMKGSPSETGNENGGRQQPAVNKGNWDTVRNRKAGKVTTTMNGGVMKLLVKFRSVSIRSMLASLAKPRQVTSPCPRGNRPQNERRSEVTLRNNQRLIKPSDKWLLQRNHGESNSHINNTSQTGEKSRVLEVNLDTIRAPPEVATRNAESNNKQAKSCPSSIKSSPIHQEILSVNKVYARENSIQAAIAHCKRSFGQTDDFSC
ncbi:unnamed protein product [Ilex paraguariensis]|uniref:Membrane-associated kinase regulator 4 n=1 Tax=Ilex paraguariensis TaxID=185542 RepID=A0ABC8S9D2_9AQUA